MFALVLVVGGFLLEACAAPAPAPRDPQREAALRALENVAIATPRVEVTRDLPGTRAEPAPEDTKGVERRLASLLPRQLRLQGLSFHSTDVAGGWPAPSAAELEEAHQEIASQLRRAPGVAAAPPPQDFLSRAFVERWQGLETDAVLFAQFYGVKRTGAGVAGEYAVKTLLGLGGVMLPGDPTGSATLVVALVEPKSGRILWSRSAEHTSTGPKPPNFQGDLVAGLVERAFADFRR